MTIRHLKIFIAVAEYGGMRKASEVLYISQPSISQAIMELEKHYNVRLFERLSKKLYITEDGKHLLSYAKHLVKSFDDLETMMMERGRNKKIHIGASVSVGTCLLDDILEKLEERDSNIEVFVIINNTSKIEELILNNELDIALVEGEIESDDIIKKPICEDELVVVVGKKNDLYKNDVIDLEKLQGQDFIGREEGSNDRNQLEQFLINKGIKLNKKWSCTNTEAIKNTVIRGNGIALLSKMIVKEEVEKGLLKILSLKNIKIKREIKLIYHKNKYISETINEFIDVCINKEI
ncbi:MAG: LysR substrate-binding domain-containing protein [Clostridium sp.]